VHDTANNPSVISISWGGPESASDETFQTQFDEILKAAGTLGITVTVASGDSGAADEGPNEWDGKAHVDFPASSPNALGCGGTNIQVSGNTITSESVWNENVTDTQDDSFGASGGGISEIFPVPSYQSSVKLPANVSTGGTGRGVPDVCGDGDPSTGYRVRADGQEFPVGGTSAVAPLWAGLVALLNQKLGHRVGFLNPFLYANPSGLVPVTKGDNKVSSTKVGYSAGPGWSACVGLGRPDASKILSSLTGPLKNGA
jgi:kumamolisin